MAKSDLESLIQQYQVLSKGLLAYEKSANYSITHHSTCIEGSTLTESEVTELLEYGKTSKNKPFEHHQMVYDHYKALVFVLEKAKEKTPLTLTLIQTIAAKVMNSTGYEVRSMLGDYDTAKGEFRLGAVRAGTRTFPDSKKVPLLMASFCEQVKEKMQNADTWEKQIDLAFWAHFELVSIHPFGDGNGRTSRLVMNYLLSYFGLPLCIVHKNDKLGYIQALEKTREKEDTAIFIAFMRKQYGKFLKGELKGLE